MRVFVLTKRTLVLMLAALLCIAIAVVLVLVLGKGGEDSTVGAAPLEEYELTVLAGKKKELPVYSVAREDKKIALTIDAAWEDDKTPFILEELDRHGIKATFYLCGFWAEKYPENVKAIAAAGHELGNHTATHPHMNELSAEQIQKEITSFDDMLEQIAGVRSKTFRAPYGEYNDLVITTTRAMGYEPIQWSIDTIDWKEERSASTILDTVLPKLAPG
ncbi:MAG: polysaccharide deacetylase family protein, partial [Clostridia bacterium]|nr:polysaccharide deacetylase family protein [Clostridia bacterium]